MFSYQQKLAINLTCHFRDTTIAGFAMLTVSGETLIWALADEGWQIYAGAVVAALSICITTTIRSNITKIVGPFEIGAVFSGRSYVKDED